MNGMNRRTLLQYTGAGAATLMLRTIAFAEESPVAATAAGKVRGTIENGINAFRGIPYGADTSTTRFRAPKPPAPWQGIRECVAWSNRAPQLSIERANREVPSASNPPGDSSFHLPPDVGLQSEDCLHLNVWTRGLRDGRKRPVLFYIHGGAYNSGTVNSVLYDGNRLCHRGDVVVVTVNHRLNAFGHLYLTEIGGAEYKDSGMAGILDLVLALQWVRDNIEAFGGDPGRVTIFGQSGGGAKCATLMAMPAAHGLFHRVLTMSGQQVTAKPTQVATATAKQILEKLGLNLQNLKEIDTMPWQTIQDAARLSTQWLPVLDGHNLPRDPFDPSAPALSAGVPMVLGNTHDETSTAAAGDGNLTWEKAPEALRTAISPFLGAFSAEDVIRRYREIYPELSASRVVVAAAVAFRAWAGQVLEADRRAMNPVSARHTWVYRIDWKVPFGQRWSLHTIDIPFWFDNCALAPGMVGEDLARAQPLADRMSSLLIEYASTGVAKWPVYNVPDRMTMIFDETSRVEKDPRGLEREFAAAAHYRQPGT